jgi:hypothetical protein
MSRPGYAHGFMRIRQQAVVACFVLLALALIQPSIASAACQTLPGRSGVEQYCETIPGATGDRSPFVRPEQSRLSHRTRAALERAGGTGRQVEALAQTAPSQGSAGKRSRKGGASPGAGGKGGPPGAALNTTGSGVTTGSSVGSGFIWALAAAALAICALALLRHRLRRST